MQRHTSRTHLDGAKAPFCLQFGAKGIQMTDKKYSLRWIEARKQYIYILSKYQDRMTPHLSIYFNNLWNSWAEKDNGNGAVVGHNVINFSGNLDYAIRHNLPLDTVE
jgi:hypothetical protein